MKHLHSVRKQSYQALLRENPLNSAKINEKFRELAQKSPQDNISFLNWLADWNSFMGEIQDAQNLYYFQYLTGLDQPENLQLYQEFLQTVQQALSVWEPKLFLILEERIEWISDLPGPYQTFIQTKLSQRHLQNDKTSATLQQLQRSSGKHPQRFMAAQIEYGGKKVGVREIAEIMKSGDRSSREVAWHATNTARRADVPFFQELFEEQVSLRHQLAEAAGKPDFVTYRFAVLGRLAYRPSDCKVFHQQLAACLPAIQDRLFDLHKQAMDWDQIYPWDLPKGPDAPRPSAQQEDEIVDQLTVFFQHLHPAWNEAFQEMLTNGYLDIMRRPGKTMGAMAYQMKRGPLPLMIASYDGTTQGLTQLIHEMGHVMHFYHSHRQALLALRPIPPELGELFALTFELIAISHGDCFFEDEGAADQLLRTQLYRVFSLLSLSIALDAFQHQVYCQPTMTAAERNACWQKQYLRFHGDAVSWHPFEEELSLQWLKHYHVFEAPLYSIEYAIAQLGALQLWQQYQQAPQETLAKMHHVMSLGFSRSVSDLYAELGLELFPSEEKIGGLLGYCLDLFEA